MDDVGNTARPCTKDGCVGDINCNGRLDVIATEENRSASLYWYEAPADPTALHWQRHTIGTGFSELDFSPSKTSILTGVQTLLSARYQSEARHSL